jgi:hypothetical protein
MIDTFHERDEALVRYHFNELGDAERIGLEDEMLLDEELFERAHVVEMNLIDSYVRGEMTAEERMRFERGFLAASENRDKVARARMFHKSLGRLHEGGPTAPPEAVPEQAGAEPRRERIRRLGELFRRPLPSLAFGALALLLVFGGLYYLVRITGRLPADSDTARTHPTPSAPKQTLANTPTPDNSPPADATPPPHELLPAPSLRAAPQSKGVELARNDSARYTKEVCLFCEDQAGSERSGGDLVHITLGKKIRYLKLRHELLGDIRDRDSYFVTIYDKYDDPLKLKGDETKQEVKTVRRKEAGRLRRFVIVELPVSTFKDNGPYKFVIDEPNFSPAMFTIKLR